MPGVCFKPPLHFLALYPRNKETRSYLPKDAWPTCSSYDAQLWPMYFQTQHTGTYTLKTKQNMHTEQDRQSQFHKQQSMLAHNTLVEQERPVQHRSLLHNPKFQEQDKPL